MTKPNTIFWEDVTDDMQLTAKEGSWFANGRLVYWVGKDAAEARARLGSLYQKQKQEREKPDLELKALDGFSGTEEYHRLSMFPSFNLTDGVDYIMRNGYSYLVTDILALIPFKPRLKNQPFLAITYSVNLGTKTGGFIITDGNETTLYTQNYGYTDAKIVKPLKLFLADHVLMLAGEY